MCKKCITKIVNKSVSTEISTAMLEWDHDNSTEFAHKFKCVCGKSCKKGFVVENKKNNNSIELGIDCYHNLFEYTMWEFID